MIRFAVISDVQYGDLDSSANRSYRESLSKFLLATGEILIEKPSFVIQLGDASQSGWHNHTAILELFKVAEKHGITWKHTLGNHDFLVPDSMKQQIYKNFGLNVKGYYDFLVEDSHDANNLWRFIVLNGNEISTYAATTPEEKKFAEEERKRWQTLNDVLPQSWNGSVSIEQLQWLENKLTMAEKNQEKVIICSHFPLFAKSQSLNSKRSKLASLLNLDIYYSNLGISVWNGDEIFNILDKHDCVKGYLAGHLHEGSYGIRNNVAHITFKGMVENTPNAYAFVELTPTSIIVDGRSTQPSYRFDFN